MPEVNVLDVLLHDAPIGTLTRVQGDRTIFAFDQSYIGDPARPTLSLSFKDRFGGLITDIPAVQRRVPPFFANMLPEGAMREYLAQRAGVNPQREFFLLWVLGHDLPGAVRIRPAEGEDWPPATAATGEAESQAARRANALRFSLAGVQLKFSAVKEVTGGLTIPAQGVGGSWIVKLPSTTFAGVPENEYAMMSLAAKLGMNVPEIELVEPASIANLPRGIEDIEHAALAVKRFDRTDEDRPVHIEDFAQVFNIFPEAKYGKASYRNIADVLAIETDEDDIAEFVRRLVFNTLIGNADMHLKNWSLIYPDGRNPALAPAYDFVSTIAYIEDAESALKFARSRRFDALTLDELGYLADKARLPEKLVLDTATGTVAAFNEIWPAEKRHLPLTPKAVAAIDAHLDKLPIAKAQGKTRVS